MQPDMWSGWGIRTLSAEPPSVQSLQLSDRRGLAARQRHHRHRLPPLWLRGRSRGCGTQHQRCRQPFPDEPAAGTLCRPATRPEQLPVQYVGANVPQAWAAGAPFVLLQVMLGIWPDAPNGKLYVDPVLPDWLPDVTLFDLRLGRRTFDVRFWRDGADTKFEVTAGRQPLGGASQRDRSGPISSASAQAAN